MRIAYQTPEILEKLNDEEYKDVLFSQYFYDIQAFARDICTRWTCDLLGSHIATPDFHNELWNLARSGEDFVAIISRDHGKTTAVSKILGLWFLLYEKEKSLLYVMSKGLGEIVVGDIKKELETNEEIKFIYGSLVPIEDRTNNKTEKWRARELQLLNGTELKSVTKGEPVRGRRPTKIIIDDPQENKDVKNPILCEEFNNWIWTAVYPTLSKGGSMAVLGTIISNNCFVNVLKNEADQRKFRIVEYPALADFNYKTDIITDENGVKFLKGIPLWPDRWPMEALEKRCQKMGIQEFAQEYLNIPFAINGSPVFSETYNYKIVEPLKIEDEIKYYNAPGMQERGFIGVDVANGGVGGDFSTIVARNASRELVAQYRGHCSQTELARITDKFVVMFKNCIIVPENNIALAYLEECKKFTWHGRIYRQKSFDKVLNKQSDIIGFNTNAKTKPILRDALDEVFKLGNYEVSKELHEEIVHYYFDEKGGMNAISPYHDDLVIADALCNFGIKKGVFDLMPIAVF